MRVSHLTITHRQCRCPPGAWTCHEGSGIEYEVRIYDFKSFTEGFDNVDWRVDKMLRMSRGLPLGLFLSRKLQNAPHAHCYKCSSKITSGTSSYFACISAAGNRKLSASLIDGGCSPARCTSKSKLVSFCALPSNS